MTPDVSPKPPSRLPEADSRVPFRVHARALAALGRDLVTDDVVAMMELVKNSYDALATCVDVRIRPAKDLFNNEAYIEVADDGEGMDYETVRDAWFMIATPSRAERPTAEGNDSVRAVTGEKGLGRLAAARLGDDIRVRTRQTGGPVLEFSLKWNDLFQAEDIGHVGTQVSQLPDDSFDRAHGTVIRIGALRSEWDANKINALGADLARLVSPFGPQDFSIRLDVPGRDGTADVRDIRLPEYMSEPKYRIAGRWTPTGPSTGDTATGQSAAGAGARRPGRRTALTMGGPGSPAAPLRSRSGHGTCPQTTPATWPSTTRRPGAEYGA